ncbi:MAG: 5-bromo-4-chloroindolyl phosphate hydrolysis family protein [Oscillospiraceae bacterium]|nr:5-bromo-4-chloroindolyl phosphate hydrolysis family protein [Oscillospiraceae bacterium]
MPEYFDKEKFTGGTNRGSPPPRPTPPPRRPDPEKDNNAWWYSWPAIIILFSLGIWPVALGLLFYNLFWDKKKKTQTAARSAAERAVESASQRFDRAAGETDEAIRRAASQVEQSVSRAAKQVERTVNYGARRAGPVEYDAHAQPGHQPQQAQPKPVKTAKMEKQKKQKKKSAGILMRTIGVICLAIGGIAWLDFLSGLIGYGYADTDDFFSGLGFLTAGGITFGRGMYLNRLSRRSQRYILAIGNVDAMPIDVIAKRVNRKPKQAMKELQKLIDKGYMGEDAYIDYERGYFLRFGATLEEDPPFEEPEPEPVLQTPGEAEEGYSGILRNIRRTNDRIADPELSRKIERLEQVTGKIFREVEEHPEKRESIHMFFDYYLPTTQKLLDAYADFEETGVEGEHLRQAKERIEQMMDTIVSGFEHQLDQLYSSDAMDVVSDLKVMEAMLKRDTATVAKDFGFEPPGREQDGGPPRGLQI